MRSYNVYDTPKGKAKLRHAPTVTSQMRKRAEHDSFVGTCKLRHKLNDVKVKEYCGGWYHVNRQGKYLVRFETVGEAVAAL